MFSPVSPGCPFFQVFTKDYLKSHLQYLLLYHHSPYPQHTHTHTHTHIHTHTPLGFQEQDRNFQGTVMVWEGSRRVVPKFEILRMLCMHARVCVCVCACVQPTRLLCPWDSPGKNTRVGCHFLLQGIFFPTQGSNRHLLHWQADSFPLNHLGGLQVSWVPPKNSQRSYNRAGLCSGGRKAFPYTKALLNPVSHLQKSCSLPCLPES